MQKAPLGIERQVQWLVDRAEIQDLIAAYGRTADTKDWDGYADLFAAEGKIVWPYGDIPKDRIAGAIAGILAPFERTHHMLTNIAIEIDGDTAKARHYLQSVHVPDAAHPGRHADVGGWYDNEYRRTEDGWRIVRLDLSFVWVDGLPFEPGDVPD